jgi:hypothetical protein
MMRITCVLITPVFGVLAIFWPPQLVGAEGSVSTVVTADVPQVVTKEFFGLHIHRANQAGVWPSIPFGSWRLWDAHVSWPHLQTGPMTWDFDPLDRYVQIATGKGIELLMPLGLSPTWASARQSEPSAYNQPGWAAEPRNIGI